MSLRKTSGFGFLFIDLNLDLIANDANRIRADFDARIIGPSAITEPKAPRMPGTGHNTSFDRAAAERGAHVGTGIIDGKIAIALVEDRHQVAINRKRAPLTHWKVRDTADGTKLGHEQLLSCGRDSANGSVKPLWTGARLGVIILPN